MMQIWFRQIATICSFESLLITNKAFMLNQLGVLFLFETVLL